MLLQRRLRWFRPAGENIREVINQKRGGQLKTWITTPKDDLARLSGPAVYGLRRWDQGWMTIGIAWAQDRGPWAAAVGDAVVAIDAGATAPRRMPDQVSMGSSNRGQLSGNTS